MISEVIAVPFYGAVVVSESLMEDDAQSATAIPETWLIAVTAFTFVLIVLAIVAWHFLRRPVSGDREYRAQLEKMTKDQQAMRREEIGVLISRLEKQITVEEQERERARAIQDPIQLSAVEVIRSAKKEESEALAQIVGIDPGAGPEKLEESVRSSGTHWFGVVKRSLQEQNPYVQYEEVVRRVAKKSKVEVDDGDSPADLELKIVKKTFKTMLDRMSSKDRKRVLAEMKREGAKHEKRFQGVATGALTVAAAQASGFGVYLMASTVVGAMTSALGVTLPFAFYTGMSSWISLSIGPVGWVILGLWGLNKIAAPAYKRAVPAVLLVAQIRLRLKERESIISDAERQVGQIKNKLRQAYVERQILRELSGDSEQLQQ